MNNVTFETLQKIPLFSHFNAQQLRVFADKVSHLSLAPDEVLFRQGELSNVLYVVVSGTLVAKVQAEDDVEIEAREIISGSVIDEVQVMTGGLRTVSAYAKSDAELLEIDRSVIEAFIAENPSLLEPMITTISGEIRRNQLVDMLPNLFGKLGREEMHDIEQHLTWKHLQRGDCLMQQDSPSDGIYLLISGRLVAVQESEHGGNDGKVIGTITPGESVGEMAYFTGEPRSASVYAIRDADLVEFTHSAFDYITETYPLLIRSLTKLLIQRIRSQSKTTSSKAVPTNIAIVAISADVPLEDVVSRLHKTLTVHGSTQWLSGERVDELLSISGASEVHNDSPISRRLLALMDKFEAENQFVLYQADNDQSAWTQRCLRQADLVLLVGQADRPPVLCDIEKTLDSNTTAWTSARRMLVLLHPNGDTLPSGTAEWLAPRAVEKHIHIRWDRDSDVERLARVLSGNMVGVVLGGGGARGAAHIGVLKALDDKGVPIDYLGGTSAGAGISALYAKGFSYEEMKKIYVKALVEIKATRPLTIPIISLIPSKTPDSQIKLMFDETKIEDLWIPFYCISCDVAEGKKVVHEQGSLWKAVRATTSLPGIYAPFIDGQSLMVDGGILDNLPYSTMLGVGASTLIIVDISNNPPLDIPYDYENTPSAGRILSSWINPFKKSLKVTTLIDVITRTAMVTGLSEQKQASIMADLFLKPPVDHYGMLDFSKQAMNEMADIAYQYTTDELAQWLKHNMSFLREPLIKSLKNEIIEKHQTRTLKHETAQSCQTKL